MKDDIEALLDVTETEMIRRHAEMYADLNARSKEVDSFDRRVAAYNADVKRYSTALRDYHASKIAALGGCKVVLRSTSSKPTTKVAPRVQNLPDSLEAEAKSLVWLSEQLGYRHIMNATGFSRTRARVSYPHEHGDPGPYVRWVTQNTGAPGGRRGLHAAGRVCCLRG